MKKPQANLAVLNKGGMPADICTQARQEGVCLQVEHCL